MSYFGQTRLFSMIIRNLLFKSTIGRRKQMKLNFCSFVEKLLLNKKFLRTYLNKNKTKVFI